MKPIYMFVLGAITAGGLVSFVMQPKDPKPDPAPVAITQPVQPEHASPIDEQPSTKPEPVESVATTPERPLPEIERRPAATPRRSPRPVQRAEVRPPEIIRAPQTTPPVQPASGGLAGPPPTPPIHIEPPQTATAAQPVEERKPVRVPQTVTIPAGTLLTVRVDQSISSETSTTGDTFRASLDQPLVVNGFVIAERGARVEGKVAASDPGGRVRGVASLGLELTRLNTSDGQRLQLQTESFAKEGERNTKRDIAKVGAAAGIGAAIGAIAGGGKGAAIGAAVGGAAGTGGVMATRGGPAMVPAETRLSFRLSAPVTVTERLN